MEYFASISEISSDEVKAKMSDTKWREEHAMDVEKYKLLQDTRIWMR